MRRSFRVPWAIFAGLVTLGQSARAVAQDLEVAVVFRAEDELAAKRLVAELGAMDLRAHLVAEAPPSAPALVRFLDRDRVSVVCCGPPTSDRQLEVIADADPSLLALRTGERLRALGLGRLPPAETFYTTVRVPPPPPPRERWLTLRVGAGVLAPSPSFGPGALFTAAGSLSIAGPLALTVLGHGTLSSPEIREQSLWVEGSPAFFAAGPTYARSVGPLAVHASATVTYLRSPMRYRVGEADERTWLRKRVGPGITLTGLAQAAGPLSFFVDLTVAYMAKDPSVRRYAFREGAAFAPLIAATFGVAWTFPDVMGRRAERSSSAR